MISIFTKKSKKFGETLEHFTKIKNEKKTLVEWTIYSSKYSKITNVAS